MLHVFLDIPLTGLCGILYISYIGDGSKAKRAKEVQAMGTVDPYAKIALFPMGYRKKAAEPISPRGR